MSGEMQKENAKLRLKINELLTLLYKSQAELHPDFTKQDNVKKSIDRTHLESQAISKSTQKTDEELFLEMIERFKIKDGFLQTPKPNNITEYEIETGNHPRFDGYYGLYIYFQFGENGEFVQAGASK